MINLRQLKVTEIELIDIYTTLLGHRFISLSFAMMYYPFAYVTLFGLTQSLLLVAYFLMRLCGSKGKLPLCASGGIYLLNLLILCFGLYGMVTAVPDASGSCLDLSL